MTLAATKASSRHRVRITNKTRLRVTRQPLDDLQETRDDEVARADVSTAGVDVEDAKVGNHPARRRPLSPRVGRASRRVFIGWRRATFEPRFAD